MARVSVARVQAKIIAKAWKNEAFRKRLIKSPHKALAKEGVEVPAGVKVKVLQNTATVMHLVVPNQPSATKSRAKRPRTPARMGPTFTFG